MGAAGLWAAVRRAAGAGDLPPDQSGAADAGERAGAGRAGPAHGRNRDRDRQPHHHGQRAGRAGLGRWRDRGGAGGAWLARADPVAAHLPGRTDRRARCRRDRDRHRAARFRRAARRGRGGPDRRVFRRRAGPPDAARPGGTGQHVPGIRSHGGALPGRSGNAGLSCGHGPRTGGSGGLSRLCQGHRAMARCRSGAALFPHDLRCAGCGRAGHGRAAPAAAGPSLGCGSGQPAR